MKVIGSVNPAVTHVRPGRAMTLPRMMAMLVFLGVLGLNVHAVRDPDLWWHLATGFYVVDSGSIPTVDPGFAFTTADNVWFMHEWLSEVVMIWLYGAIGLEGLSVFFGLVVAFTYLLVYLVSPGRPYLATLVTLFIAFAGFGYTSVRPHMFNLLLGALIVFLVESIKDKRISVHWLWILPPITAIWVNLHSGFLFGFAILAVYLVGEIASAVLWKDARELGWPNAGVLAVVTAVSAAASGLNHNQFAVWRYPFETLRSEAMRAIIVEWQAPDFHNWYFMLFGLIFVGTLTLMVLNRQRPAATDLLFVLGTGVASLQSARHISLFLILAVPIICRHLTAILDDFGWVKIKYGQETAAPNWIQNTVNWLLVICAIALLYYWVGLSVEQTERVVSFHFPVNAVNYMEAEELTDGRVFNAYEWGGYLIWRGIPPFIDGRADLYGDEFMFLYQETLKLENEWQATLDEYDIAYVLLKPDDTMGRFLTLDVEHWELLYEDEIAQLFGRVAN